MLHAEGTQLNGFSFRCCLLFRYFIVQSECTLILISVLRSIFFACLFIHFLYSVQKDDFNLWSQFKSYSSMYLNVPLFIDFLKCDEHFGHLCRSFYSLKNCFLLSFLLLLVLVCFFFLLNVLYTYMNSLFFICHVFIFSIIIFLYLLFLSTF